MNNIKEVYTCRCSHCGDTFEVNNEVIGVSNLYGVEKAYIGLLEDIEKSIKWWTEAKKCLRCGEYYIPDGQGRIMDNFVLEKIQSCKM